jgi:hypothetical protein
MKTIKILTQGGALALSLLACAVMAAVTPEEAGKLGTTLTPVGAELAGNADGSIPAWNGGLPATAGTADANGFLADPFADARAFCSRSVNAARRRGLLAVTVTAVTPSRSPIAAAACAREAASSRQAFVSASSIKLELPPIAGAALPCSPAWRAAMFATPTLDRSTVNVRPSSATT